MRNKTKTEKSMSTKNSISRVRWQQSLYVYISQPVKDIAQALERAWNNTAQTKVV